MATAPGKFVWPPRNPALAETTGAPEPAPTKPIALALSPKDAASMQVERTWMAMVAPPTPVRLAEASWCPDGPGSYCRRCGTTIGVHESVDGEGCHACRNVQLAWDRSIRLSEYSGVLRDMLHDLKFTRWRRIGQDLGAMLAAAISQELLEAKTEASAAALVPIPTTFRRRIVRGIDHTLVLARGAARESDLPLIRALARRHRPSQVSVPLSQRRVNLRGSFRCLRADRIRGCRIVILVDDIRTTGATMTAAARALRQALGSEDLPEIWSAVVAVTPEPRGRSEGPGRSRAKDEGKLGQAADFGDPERTQA